VSPARLYLVRHGSVTVLAAGGRALRLLDRGAEAQTQVR
jgi:hypothetical protein